MSEPTRIDGAGRTTQVQSPHIDTLAINGDGAETYITHASWVRELAEMPRKARRQMAEDIGHGLVSGILLALALPVALAMILHVVLKAWLP